jgi:hypothetical protein
MNLLWLTQVEFGKPFVRVDPILFVRGLSAGLLMQLLPCREQHQQNQQSVFRADIAGCSYSRSNSR